MYNIEKNMNPNQKALRLLQRKDGAIYPYTDVLAKKKDFVEVSFNGERYVPVFEVVSRAQEKPAPPVDEKLKEPSKEEKPAPPVDEKLKEPSKEEKPAPPVMEDSLESQLGFMNKNELERYAKKKFGVDLDKRKGEKSLIAEILELADKDEKDNG